MDRDAAYGEVIPTIDAEPTTLEEPARAFTGLYEKRLDPRIRGNAFQSGIDRRADACAYQVGAAVEMIDMPVGLKITVANDRAIVANSDQRCSANCFLHIAFGIWFGGTPGGNLLRRVIANCGVVDRHMK